MALGRCDSGGDGGQEEAVGSACFLSGLFLCVWCYFIGGEESAVGGEAEGEPQGVGPTLKARPFTAPLDARRARHHTVTQTWTSDSSWKNRGLSLSREPEKSPNIDAFGP